MNATFLKIIVMAFFAIVTNNYNLNAAQYARQEAKGSLSSLQSKVGESPHNLVLIPCKSGEEGMCKSWERFKGYDAFAKARAWSAIRPQNSADAAKLVAAGRMTKARAAELMSYCGGWWAEWDEVIAETQPPQPAPVQQEVIRREYVVEREVAPAQAIARAEASSVTKTTTNNFFNNMSILNGNSLSLNSGGGGGGWRAPAPQPRGRQMARCETSRPEPVCKPGKGQRYSRPVPQPAPEQRRMQVNVRNINPNNNSSYNKNGGSSRSSQAPRKSSGGGNRFVGYPTGSQKIVGTFVH